MFPIRSGIWSVLVMARRVSLDFFSLVDLRERGDGAIVDVDRSFEGN